MKSVLPIAAALAAALGAITPSFAATPNDGTIARESRPQVCTDRVYVRRFHCLPSHNGQPCKSSIVEQVVRERVCR